MSARKALASLTAVSIRSPQEMPIDFQWRQVVKVVYGERKPREFDAVLEKSGRRMTLLGMTPLGTVTFVAEAEGTRVRFENRTGETLPFDGTYILRDVQRVFFPWLSGSVRNGWRTGRFGEEMVRERVVDGQVVERRFERRGKLQAKIEFLEPVAAYKASPRVKLENMRFGYLLDIQTLVP
ncbi:MAG: DUF3261 domain-containing protein [Myxococcales bacterium]|nr:DUF3261 domain-containing protein [Myxococcales bacterium]